MKAETLWNGTEAEKLTQIAKLDPMQYDRLREALAADLGVRVSVLDQERAKRRKVEQPDGLDLADPEPWPEEVDGAELLDSLAAAIDKYMVIPPTSRDAVALWVVLTYAVESVFILPLLAIQSPQKRCGKSTLLIILRKLCRRALLASNLSPAVLYRVVEKYSPTLLLDEADSWMKENEELRGIVNSGHSRDTACVLRVEGDAHEPRAFSTFCPKALAGIGSMWDTVEDRSVIVPLRRRRPDEVVEKLRLDRLDLGHFRCLALRWATDHADHIRAADPAVPDELHDRAADNWRPLLAIADLAGGVWPERGRRAAVASALVGADRDTIEVLLLGDIRVIFQTRGDPITSADLCEALAAIEERPWAEWKHGRPITTIQLARLLDKFEVRPMNLKVHNRVLKGYREYLFEDAFARYLKTVVSPATALPEQESKGNGAAVGATAFGEVAGRPATYESTVATETKENPAENRICSEVAAQSGENRAEEREPSDAGVEVF